MLGTMAQESGGWHWPLAILSVVPAKALQILLETLISWAGEQGLGQEETLKGPFHCMLSGADGSLWGPGVMEEASGGPGPPSVGPGAGSEDRWAMRPPVHGHDSSSHPRVGERQRDRGGPHVTVGLSAFVLAPRPSGGNEGETEVS